MIIKNLTEKALLDNITREPLPTEQQTCESDAYYKSVIGTLKIWGEMVLNKSPIIFTGDMLGGTVKMIAEQLSCAIVIMLIVLSLTIIADCISWS